MTQIASKNCISAMQTLFAILALSAVNVPTTSLFATDDLITFNQHIRPILADKCFACHGRDANKRQADLRLDTFEGATSDESGTQAIVPGKPSKSELWVRINEEDEDSIMPPPDSHKPLNADEKKLVKRWIEQGAEYQQHWSFEPIQTVEPPFDGAAPKNPIDAFIARRLAKENWSIAAEANRPTLIRRVSFALTGLPPTITQVDEFLADSSPEAYDRMVDRFLDSKHYGEEMARHWLDVARYADTHGLHLDNERQMWAYRDWVIDSFNRNQRFDEFTVEQLAGDMLNNPTREQLIATGFNRCNVTTSEGGSIDAEFTFRYAVDRASTTSQTWLGLTAGCAACHDHKFDPISQKEFYSLYAFFNSAADPAMDGNALLTAPVMKLESEQDKVVLKGIDDKIVGAQKAIDQAAAELAYADPAEIEPPPAASQIEIAWMDDDFPSGGKIQGSPGHPTQFVSLTEGGQVFSGQRALKRSDAGLSQDVWDQATTPLVIPQNGILYAHVWIEPTNSPQSLMLQFYRQGWLHRAVWGNYDVIAWGAANTTERVAIGSIPETGKWIRLEVPAEKVGLHAGDLITGFATTQFGGTVYWDKVGVSGVSDPASDPLRSFKAWWNNATGKDTPGLPGDLAAIAKSGPTAETKKEDRDRLRVHYLQSLCVDTKPHFEESIGNLAKLRAERDSKAVAIPSTFVFKDLPQPRESFVMLRGQYNAPGDKVESNVPAILPPLKKSDESAPANRLDLARWIVAPENPLTARVTVNRLWQQFFGVGLVKSSSDFGTQGESPSHPELLDWLAKHFQETDWDVRDLVRLMVTSSTFRQSSRATQEMIARDPENRLYARGPRFRLDAEQIRDNSLYVSGLMNLEMGGKGVKPYQPINIWEPVGFVGSNTQYYVQDKGAALYRRSLYTFFKRTAPPPYMTNFDGPNREQSCTRRERSNTPLQALQLMNDVQHVEAARALAEKLLASANPGSYDRITLAFKTILARSPTADELGILGSQLQHYLERFKSTPDDAKKLIGIGATMASPDLPADELAAYTLVVSTILNMDETLTRN